MRLILYFLLLVAAPVRADQDADFLAANDAFRAGDAVKLQRLAQRLKNTPLEVYVNYYQLRIGLDRADTGAIRKFLSRPEDTPMIDQLRGEWLRLLGSRQQWQSFDAEYPLLLKEDTELTCYILQSRLRNHDQSALREARALWFNSKGQPESCGVPFEAAISAGVITEQDIGQRLRLALESGNVSLAKQLFTRLDGGQTVSSRALESAASDALRYLDRLKLDDPASLVKAGPLAAQANRRAAVEAGGKSHTQPYRKPAEGYPLLVKPAVYPEGTGVEPKLSGADIRHEPDQPGTARPGFYTTPGFPLADLPPDYAKGSRSSFATGCLNPLVLPDTDSHLLDGKSAGRHICPDPCGILSVSAFLAVQQRGLNGSKSRLFLSDLKLGGIDTAVVESILTMARPIDSAKNMVTAQATVKATAPGLLPGGEGAVATAGRQGWAGLLDRFGLGKSDSLTVTATDNGLPASAGCDSCASADGVSTVSPMEWHPKLASEGQRAIVLFALQRLAKQSPELAAARWMKIAAYFPAPEQRYFYGRLAYEAARDLDGRALQWYKASTGAQLNEQQSAWRVRAALRAPDWDEVLASINAMSEQQQREAAWRYWKARALLALGRTVEARDLLAPLSSEHHFYGQLAGDELAGTPLLSKAVATYKPDSQALAEMKALPGVQRTLALYRMGLRSEALEEWRWLIRNFNDRELITAAEIARRNEMYDRAIGAADKTVSVHDFGLRFLAPYRELLQEHIREHGLEEAWVYGLMRQESRFVSSAKSNVGAAGLMQIMPATARWVASKLGLKSYRNALIHQLDTNLRLGTYYMKSILSQFDDSPVMASAAYNAGPRRAREWRGDHPLEGAVYAETIPFEETRDYVKKVMSNTVYYASQFNAPLRSLKQRLGTVAGRAEDKLEFVPAIPGELAEP